MFKRTKINRCAMLALGGALLVPASAAYAQVAGEQQRIEVTGSRIKSLGAVSNSPITLMPTK